MIIIKTSNPLKKKDINRILNVSDDKLENIINIIELISNSDVTNSDTRNIRFLVQGYTSNKIKSTYIES